MALLTCACVCTRDKDKSDGAEATDGVRAAATFALASDQAQTDLGELTKEPHPFGSPRQAEVAAYLTTRAQAGGAEVKREEFTADVPNPAALAADAGPVAQTLTRSGANLYAFAGAVADAPCVVALASHFDTKPIDGIGYLGANDSGSSTAVLLQQLAFVKAQAATLGLTCEVVGVFFDAEEAVLFNWSDGTTRHPANIEDHTYGSRHGAGRLTSCTYDGAAAFCLPADLGGKPLVALILMDMIGSPSIQITRDTLSTPALVQRAAAAAEGLGVPYDRAGNGMEDDHIAYRQAGVSVLDLIDFNHLDYWHRDGDEAGKLSMESMQLAGRLALAVALDAARAPKVLLQPAD
jgi:hypothetical protein